MKKFLAAVALSLLIFGGQTGAEASTVAADLSAQNIETQEVSRHYKPLPPPPPGRHHRMPPPGWRRNPWPPPPPPHRGHHHHDRHHHHW